MTAFNFIIGGGGGGGGVRPHFGGNTGGGGLRPYNMRSTHSGGLFRRSPVLPILMKTLLTLATVLALIIIAVGCSTANTRDQVLRDMVIGASVGALIAQTKSDNREAYTAMYAGAGAATAGAISVYLNVSKDDSIKNENEQLKSRLDQFQKQLQPQLVQKGSSLFTSPLPKEVAGLVEPGEWRRYKMDQWVQDPNQSNTWYRQVEMFEIIPPVSK
ncbi:MAG: hypothetical protein BroJett040_08050 [Oligoflexia bacterium]|nr:MAG: hypothetical protein BroJett040_08050 [Oligoflexia bacterium]